MDLKSYLDSLSLGVYASIFAERGYTSVDQLTSLGNQQLDQLFTSLALLKGHAIKLRKSVEVTRAAEPPPTKKPKVQETSPIKPDTRVSKSSTLPQPGTILMKEAERLAAKLADIESIREDYRRAKEKVLSIDIEKYRRLLDDVVAVQDALSKAWRPDRPPDTEFAQE